MSIDGRPRNTYRLGNLAQHNPLVVETTSNSTLVLGHHGLATTSPAPCPGRREASLCALTDESRSNSANEPMMLNQETARRRRGVDRLGDGSEAHPTCFQIAYQCDEVLEAAT